MTSCFGPVFFLPLLCAGAVGAALSAVLAHLRARRVRCIAQYRLLAAAQFAAEKHCDQRRKNARSHPYINHPLRVAARLAAPFPASALPPHTQPDLGVGIYLPHATPASSTTNINTSGGRSSSAVAVGFAGVRSRAGCDDVDVLMAALLHDTIEDTDSTIGEITGRFGTRVASLVAELSDDKTLSRAERKRLQVELSPLASPGAKLVKLADKLDNLCDLLVDTPLGWHTERVAQYFEWSARVVEGLRGTDAVMERQLDAVLARSQEAAHAAEAQVAVQEASTPTVMRPAQTSAVDTIWNS